MGGEAERDRAIRIHVPEEPGPFDGEGPSLASRVAGEDPVPVHRSLPGYHPTPLHRRPDLAARAGVAEVLVKDESHRFGLGAFKALGASYALGVARRAGEDRTRTVCTATEGNHGRAVAWAARIHGLASRIYVPRDTAPQRVRAIREEGAEVEEVPGDYEAAVAEASRVARESDWLLIQDTAWEGYTEMPLRIMRGYTTALRELESVPGGADPEGDGAGPPADIVFLQGGVGSWAAAAAAYLRSRWGERCPRIVVVEPTAAACLLESAGAGAPVEAGGSRVTAMNGLNCGVPSTLAHELLSRLAGAFVAVGDGWAREAVEALANGSPVVRSAPAGAAGLAGLLALSSPEGGDPGEDGPPETGAARRAVGLGPSTRILVVNTEGALG